MNRFRITVLSDDCVSARSARAEHGVCFHIETGDRRILFDTGQGLVLADNARALGIDLGAVDTLVFSHGHYDHTGGLPIVLSAVRTPVDVHLHPDALQTKFHVSGSRARSILSAREWEVLHLIVEGFSTTEIARHRNRSVSTIATQKHNAMKKLNLSNHSELIKYVQAVGKMEE